MRLMGGLALVAILVCDPTPRRLARAGETAPVPPSSASATATRRAERGKTFVPSEILRRAAKDADSLVVVTDPVGGVKSEILHSTLGEKDIADLLRIIDTPPVEPGSVSFHLCSSSPRIRLNRRGKLVAEFSFDHAALIRPYSKGLWGNGDAALTADSARAMAAWFHTRGLSTYQQEIDEADRERAKRTGFHQTFPPAIRTFLVAQRDDRVMNPGSVELAHEEIDPKSAEPLASTVPDEADRIRMICRAFGYLAGDWSTYDDQEAVVLTWARDNSQNPRRNHRCSTGQLGRTTRGGPRSFWRATQRPQLD